MNLKENTNLVFQQISNAVQEAGRENDSVSVIAVTKYVDVENSLCFGFARSATHW